MDNNIPSASVKVMRSFDYCHFEIILGTNDVSLQQVDEMRKAAARLADKAVAQYKVAKKAAERRVYAERHLASYRQEVEAIRALAETDRSSEQKATLKAYEDYQFQASRDYDYQDDWPEDGE